MSFLFTKKLSHRQRRLISSYAPDWVCTLVLGAIFLSLDYVDGFKRDFSLDDPSLRHPYAVHERVPDEALYLLCFAAPLLMQWTVNYLTLRSFWDAHNFGLGLVLSLAITGSITQLTKITAGRPRPDLIDRCQPVSGSIDPEYKLSNISICTQTSAYILRDGFRSFPSGHSSMSFAGLGFFAFYLAGKVHLFDSRGHATKAWLSLVPFASAALIAISRTMDYRHHWQDVVVGSALGILVAYASYRLYFPPLTSSLSHLPYAPRTIQHSDDIEVLPSNYYYQHLQQDDSSHSESLLLPGTVRRNSS